MERERGGGGGGRTVPYSSDCSRLKCSPLVGKVRMSKDIVVNECMPYNKWSSLTTGERKIPWPVYQLSKKLPSLCLREKYNKTKNSGAWSPFSRTLSYFVRSFGRTFRSDIGPKELSYQHFNYKRQICNLEEMCSSRCDDKERKAIISSSRCVALCAWR